MFCVTFGIESKWNGSILLFSLVPGGRFRYMRPKPNRYKIQGPLTLAPLPLFPQLNYAIKRITNKLKGRAFGATRIPVNLTQEKKFKLKN